MKKRIYAAVLFLCMILASGCTSGKHMEDAGMYIYYLNTDDDALEKQEYENNSEKAETVVKDMLKELKKAPESIEMKSVFPKEVKVESFEIKDNCLELHFNKAYEKMKKSREVLCRAAVVQTLVQVDGIDFVSFYVGDDVLKDREGIPIGLMSADDFVQNTGSSLSSYQVTSLNLYFSNEDGTKLVSEKINDVHYSSNTSIEKLIVEQLMRGPASSKAQATIPKDTKLLGVSVKDGICYVNLDSTFLTEGYNQKPEVAIYSTVNSIIESGNASRVQILVNGASDVTYKGSIQLDRPLEWNSELIEEKKKNEKRPLCYVCLVFLLIKSVLLLLTGGQSGGLSADSIFQEEKEKEVILQGQVYQKTSTSKMQILYLKNNSINSQNESFYESKIIVYDKTFQNIAIGKTVKLRGKANVFETAHNPGNFDQRQYYAKQNIYGMVWGEQIMEVSGKTNRLMNSLYGLKQAWKEKLTETMGEKNGAVLSAILLSEKKEMDAEIKELYQKNGIGHVLAISGLHISFIGLSVYQIFRKVGSPYFVAGIGSGILLFLYVLMIGLSVSVIRAAIMLLLRIGADMTGRVYDMATGLFFAGAVTVLWQPLYLADAGFFTLIRSDTWDLNHSSCNRKTVPVQISDCERDVCEHRH